MQSQISNISVYQPENRLTNQMLLDEFPGLKVRELTRLTGVYSRAVTAENETSVDMAVQAAGQLFAKNGVEKSSIDFIIFCSAGGDYITPASACVLQDKLGLSHKCGAFDINQGCTGYIYGLGLADSLIKAGNASKILLLTSEAITKTIHPKDRANRAIFGDAATASVIEVSTGVSKMGRFVFGTDGSRFDQIIIKHGRERFPLPQFAEADFLDEYGNVRNHASFYMNGSEVFNFSVAKAPVLVNTLLEQSGLVLDDIKLFVFHQANRIILETIGRKLKIPEEKIIIELEKTGNTVSSTIPIALQKAVETGRCHRGDKILLAGFGVGFSWGGTVLSF
ncbi:MAG: ketoacyl-ACP synthase III [Bacteroidales bacterium]|nr:ketoacyl-ACP synthase III [Bacteroidales bacterium]MCF6342297.1 ketoacyl-ACP synthase III [Bacteroidales bacterium]